MIGSIFQRLIWWKLGAYAPDEAMIAGMLKAIEEDAARPPRL